MLNSFSAGVFCSLAVFSPFGAALASVPAVEIAKGNPATRNGGMRPRPRSAFAPELCQKLEGAGNTGCTLHPRSRVQQCTKKRTRAYRFSGGNPAFPAQWFYGLFRALPGEPGFLATVAPEKLASRELDASVGASGPHV